MNCKEETVSIVSAKKPISFPLLSARHVLRRKLDDLRRLNHLDTETQHSLQLDALYQGYGTHYVDLWVGTPNPQRQTVIVDTGSSVTAFPCVGCKNCGYEGTDIYHTDSYFDPGQSTTFRKLPCDECRGGVCSGNQCSIRMSYAEGSSWAAYEAEDYLYAGGSHTQGITVELDKETGEILISPEEMAYSVAKFEIPYVFGCQTSLTGLFRTQLADGIMVRL